MDRMTFANKLRRLRIEKGYNSQQSFAEALNTTRAAVNAWEAGRYMPSRDMLVKIGTLLDCPVEFLVENQDKVLMENRAREINRRSEEIHQEDCCTWGHFIHLTLGSRIAHAREFRGMTQAALAQEIGVEAGTISQWETDRSKPSPSKLKRLAEILDVSGDYLLGLTAQRKNRLPSGVEIGSLFDWWADAETVLLRGVGEWQKRLEKAYEKRRLESMERGTRKDVLALIIEACLEENIPLPLALPCEKLVEKIRHWQRSNQWDDYEMIEQLGAPPREFEKHPFVQTQDWATMLRKGPKAMRVNEDTNTMFQKMAELMGISLRELFDDDMLLVV